MLKIPKRHNVVQAFTAGSFAFAIGLTGVAAYMSTQFESQEAVFSKEQTTEKPTATKTPTSDSKKESAAKNDGESEGATSVGATIGSRNETFIAPTSSSQKATSTPAGAGASAPTPPAPTVPSTSPVTDTTKPVEEGTDDGILDESTNIVDNLIDTLPTD